MNNVTSQQIEKVIFHWSESIVITKTIDPTFRAIHDANYCLPYRQAQALINLAIDEMKQTNSFIKNTSITLCFKCGKKKSIIVGLSESRSKLLDLV